MGKIDFMGDRNRNFVLLLFYGTVLVSCLSFFMYSFFREPYPSVNMPAFVSSGVKDGTIPATSFWLEIRKNDSIVLSRDLREVFHEISGPKYVSSMRFLFFGEAGARFAGGAERQKQVFLKLFRSEWLYNSIYNRLHQVPENQEELAIELLCKRLEAIDLSEKYRVIICEIRTIYNLENLQIISTAVVNEVVLQNEMSCEN